MMLVGVKSGDLPGALTMLADYFQRQNDVWTRLKSMMTYPLIVMFAAFLISMAIALLWTCAIGPSFKEMFYGMNIMLPKATLFAFATLTNHLGLPGGAGCSVFARNRHRLSAGAARKIPLAAARVQGSDRLTHRFRAWACCSKTAFPCRKPSAWWNNSKTAPPRPLICSNGENGSPRASRNFPRSPPSIA